MDFVDRASKVGSHKDSSLLFDTLMRVSQTMRLRFNEWLARFELNDGRYAVLKVLAGALDRGCSQAELAEQLGQSESNISTMIERMQRDDLVNRLRSDADRRKRVLFISPAGRSILEQVDASLPNLTHQTFKGFSAVNQSMLLALLQQLGRSLQNSSSINDMPTLRIATNIEEPEKLSAIGRRPDPIDDPKSPQFALQQLLLALSVHAGTDSMEKDVA
jgi:DNA-binding MarR family transcriptional regulator